jgi:5-methylcytosine-specific restriction endonuclease McrA
MLERTRWLIEYFRLNPCADCGEPDPIVLEFDHLRDKSFAIGPALSQRNWNSILDEIEKCEVVCANCHRRRTAQRRGSVRALLATQ